MTFKPTNKFSPVAYATIAPEVQAIDTTAVANSNSFEKLFAIMFGSTKLQALAGSAGLHNLLNTIANISNHHNR